MDIFRKKTLSHFLAEESSNSNLIPKVLNVRDLTFMGVAAIVGAGIFSTIGNCVYHGGAAVSLLFLFTALSCGLTAICYAQFASCVTASGSAYSYAYISFGEIIAWFIGWDLLMEYVISNIAVAISWSGYFRSFLQGAGVVIPIDFLWLGSSFHVDYPACVITVLVTVLCYIGIKESKNVNNFFIWLKLILLGIFILVGFFMVNFDNWVPFAPNGVQGVLYGISSVFFAYIGFDAITATSEECINPKKDLPKAMIYALIISTVIYILIALVISGMESYLNLQVADPLAFVFEKRGFKIFAAVIAFFSFIFLTSVLLIYQLGMPRIWASMSKDGLLPKRFSSIHPRFKTPAFATVLMGIMVGIPALFADLKEVVDLTSIGTIFSFAIICAGLWLAPLDHTIHTYASFKVTFIKSRIFFLVFFALGFTYYLINPLFFRSMTGSDLFFLGSLALVAGFSIWKNLSLFPALGLIFNLYLMAQLGMTNWSRFLIWLAIGLVIYAIYGYRKSKLRKLL